MPPAITTQGPMLAVTAQPNCLSSYTRGGGPCNVTISVWRILTRSRHLDDFRREVTQGEKLLLLCLVDGKVAGAMWLHDLLHRRDGRSPRAGPGAIFSRLAAPWPAACGRWCVSTREAAWIRHIFCAVHVANRLSQVFVTRGMQFHRVGRFPDFALFHGQPTDLFIYTLHPEDAALAWDLATARAARQMLNVAYGPR